MPYGCDVDLVAIRSCVRSSAVHDSNMFDEVVKSSRSKILGDSALKKEDVVGG